MKRYSMSLSVYGFQNDDQSWSAVGLEVGIWGEGKTFDEACDNLWELIKMQISFAVYMDKPEMILHPADPIYFDLFEKQRDRQIHSYMETTEPSGRYACGVPLPSHSEISASKDSFVLSDV